MVGIGKMAFKPFHKIRLTADQTITTKHINDVQDNVSQAIGQILGKDALDVTLLKDIKLLPGIINKIPHKLGRDLQGWIPVGNDNGYAFGLISYQSTNPSPNLLLYLTSPVACIIDLLVF